MRDKATAPRQPPPALRRPARALGASLVVLAAAAIASAALWSMGGGRPPASRPTVIMVIGDSLADGLAHGFRRLDPQHRRYSVLNETRISSGLGQRDPFDWTQALSELLQERHPDAVVILIGLNDARPSGAHFDSPSFEADYRKRIAAILDLAEHASTPMLWVGLPVMRDPELRGRADRLNRLYRDEVGTRPLARFIDVWELT